MEENFVFKLIRVDVQYAFRYPKFQTQAKCIGYYSTLEVCENVIKTNIDEEIKLCKKYKCKNMIYCYCIEQYLVDYYPCRDSIHRKYTYLSDGSFFDKSLKSECAYWEDPKFENDYFKGRPLELQKFKEKDIVEAYYPNRDYVELSVVKHGSTTPEWLINRCKEAGLDPNKEQLIGDDCYLLLTLKTAKEWSYHEHVESVYVLPTQRKVPEKYYNILKNLE